MKRMRKHQMQGVAICIFLLVLFAAECSALDDVGEWQIITKQNFSSQIRLHPHILLVVTLPWSGQARSLMKEVTRVVSGDQENYASLKLMFMFKNLEKILSDVIGISSKETTILYYHHSVAYKYRGRIRAQNILHSVNPYLTPVPGELPLKHLTTPEDLEACIDSTDKAFILLEFCGWISKLQAKGARNETKNAFGLQGKYANQEVDEAPTLKGKKSSKEMEIENMKCGVKHWLTGPPWLEELCSINEITVEDDGSRRLHGLSSCSIEEFQMFDSFFPKFINIAREFSLPSEKHRFSFVTERSLLSPLGIGDVGSWFVVFVGARFNSTMTFRDEDKIMNILQRDNPLVSELESDDGSDIGLALPANDPSVILFVDRSSVSAGIRRTSKDALIAFRELALKFHTSNHIAEKKDNVIDQASVQEYQRTQSTSRHPVLKLSSTVQMIKVEDKMSNVMVVDEGKPITLDKIVSHAQGSSLHDIFSYLLQQRKEAKLSTLAQELGFQLLSDDIDINLPHSLPFKEAEVQAYQPLSEHVQGGIATDRAGIDEDQLKYRESIHPQKNMEDFQLHNAQSFSELKLEKNIAGPNSEKLISAEYEQSASVQEKAFLEELRTKAKSSLQDGASLVEQPHFQGYNKVSFFFTDGNYRLLQSLTGGSTIPSLVVVDPILQQHYVFPDEKKLNYPSLLLFLQNFLDRSLRPYQQSESVAKSHRNPVNPPFVNLKFHETDSIPRITSQSFSELVPCLNQSKSQKAVDTRAKDVLVLFSNIWCGFCQRMELVVREVYRAMKTYINMLEKEYEDGKIVLTSDRLKEEISNLPLIYLMDCTLNECSQILKSIDQREVYPALILFLAKSKNSFLYEGDIAVTDIIRFMTEYSSNLQNLTGEKGILWNVDESGGGRQPTVRNAESISEKSFVTTDNIHEVIMKNRISESVTRFDHIEDSHISRGTAEATRHLAVGSIFVSTEKLVGVQPFDSSKILIVEVDQNRGFHGVIINKHIRWDSLQELGDGFDMLGSAPLSFGGPLIRWKMPLLALTKRVIEEQGQYPEVLPGVYFLDHSAVDHEIEEIKSGNYSLSDYWFFVGYSSWGWEQLFDEIDEGHWSLADDSMKYFDWPEN